MFNIAKWEPTETRKIAATTTSKSEQMIAKCKGIIFICDADCYVDFDRPATTGSLLVKANSLSNQFMVEYTNVSVMAVTGTANFYFLASR